MKRLTRKQQATLWRKAEKRRRRRRREAAAAYGPAKAGIRARQKDFAAIHGVELPPDRDRIPVLIPEHLSLRDNLDGVLAVIHEIRRVVLEERRRVFLYFDKTVFLEPAAALILVAECFRCRHLVGARNGYSVVGNYPKSSQIFEQLKEIGFFKLLAVRADFGPKKEPARDDRPVFLQIQTRNEVDAELAAGFCERVARGAFAMEALTLSRMVAAIKEAMGNAHEHAYSGENRLPVMPRRWWMMGHLDKKNKEMMIMLLDQGIGIPRKLPPEIFERIRAVLSRLSWSPSDGNMIAAATELHRTSTGETTRGRGFRDMKRFIDTCDDGELRVLSNKGAYAYVKRRETIDDYDESIGGTLIEWRVRHAAVAELRGG